MQYSVGENYEYIYILVKPLTVLSLNLNFDKLVSACLNKPGPDVSLQIVITIHKRPSDTSTNILHCSTCHLVIINICREA